MCCKKNPCFLRAYKAIVLSPKVIMRSRDVKVCAYLRKICNAIAHHEDADLLQTVLKDCSIVGGLTALHTLGN